MTPAGYFKKDGQWYQLVIGGRARPLEPGRKPPLQIGPCPGICPSLTLEDKTKNTPEPVSRKDIEYLKREMIRRRYSERTDTD